MALNASMNPNERSEKVDQVCIKCGRSIPVHPLTGRFHTVILHGRECAWNPDKEFTWACVLILLYKPRIVLVSELLDQFYQTEKVSVMEAELQID